MQKCTNTQRCIVHFLSLRGWFMWLKESLCCAIPNKNKNTSVFSRFLNNVWGKYKSHMLRTDHLTNKGSKWKLMNQCLKCLLQYLTKNIHVGTWNHGCKLNNNPVEQHTQTRSHSTRHLIGNSARKLYASNWSGSKHETMIECVHVPILCNIYTLPNFPATRGNLTSSFHFLQTA